MFNNFRNAPGRTGDHRHFTGTSLQQNNAEPFGMCRMYQQINIWQYSGHLFGKATQADIIAYSRLVYLKLIIISQTAFAKQQAEAANRALNTNRALDVNFDARVRTLGALDALAKQRVIEAKANKGRGFIPSSQSGVFTLQSYIDSLQKQQNEDKR